MNTKKTWYILFLVGLLLLSGCRTSTELNEESETAKSIIVMMETGIQLQQEENSYLLSGISDYFNSLIVSEEGLFKILHNGGQGHLAINLKDLKWEEKENVFNQDFSIVENIRLGLRENIPVEDLQRTVFDNLLDKIAVVDTVEKHIKIINLKNMQTTIIDSVDINEIKKPYEENIIFSPKGGYISFQIIDEKNGEGFISFGADSGKQVHDLIYGVNVRWSHGERSIAFLYREGDKIGIYKTRSKNIDYLEELSQPYSFFGFPEWSKDDSTIYYTIGVEEASYIHLVSLKDYIITRIQEELLEKQKYRDVSEVFYDNQQLVFTLNKKDGLNRIKIMEFGEVASTTYEDVSSFKFHEGGRDGVVNYLVLEEGILYIKDNSVYLMENASSKCILKNKGNIKKVQFLEDERCLIFYIDGKKDQQLIFIFLQDLV